MILHFVFPGRILTPFGWLAWLRLQHRGEYRRAGAYWRTSLLALGVWYVVGSAVTAYLGWWTVSAVCFGVGAAALLVLVPSWVTGRCAPYARRGPAVRGLRLRPPRHARPLPGMRGGADQIDFRLTVPVPKIRTGISN